MQVSLVTLVKPKNSGDGQFTFAGSCGGRPKPQSHPNPLMFFSLFAGISIEEAERRLIFVLVLRAILYITILVPMLLG